ncbi:Benzoate anaerobic degradation regulator [Hartmannibacter diazotrophicus]|uniref:Benzoate anaerobic degradation regulator n=1 Tax=Hartmannibacter diazotrophicus TaxID=1482074 RepID=A0A2C9DBS6_9HYPH|nr:MarR family transcriptional regulator [Hartmannibacter diazotrophicus]SON57588.1 Benzoate anaerobic degradation regulator [Hartmannibacter diazotrophicus]
MKTPRYPDHTDAGAALTALMLDVFRLNGALLAAGDRLVAPLGLTSARWQVLGSVALTDRSLPVAHLAQVMGLSRQAVQRVVNDLEQQGFLAFEPNPHHKRAHLVVLTEKGEAAYAVASEREAPWANALAEGLSPEDIASARQLLATLLHRLDEPALPDAEGP